MKRTEAESAVLDGAKIALLARCLDNTAQQCDFRYVTWEATREQIKRTEAATGPIWHEDEDVISYKTTFSDRAAIVSFFFDGGRFFEGLYGLQSTNDDFADHCKTQAFFTGICGLPVATRESWSEADSLSRGDKNTAIRLGKLSLLAMWRTPRSKVTVRCWRSDDLIVRHSIQYHSAIIGNN